MSSTHTNIERMQDKLTRTNRSTKRSTSSAALEFGDINHDWEKFLSFLFCFVVVVVDLTRLVLLLLLLVLLKLFHFCYCFCCCQFAFKAARAKQHARSDKSWMSWANGTSEARAARANFHFAFSSFFFFFFIARCFFCRKQNKSCKCHSSAANDESEWNQTKIEQTKFS